MIRVIKYSFLFLMVTIISVNADQTIDTYFTTAREFKQLISDEKKEGKMPRLSDKKVIEMINILSNKQDYLTSKKYSINDLSKVGDMCGFSNEFMIQYVLFGLEKEINKNDTPAINAQKTQKLAYKNILFFQDELSKLQPFFVSCMATQIPLTADFIHSLKAAEITNVRIDGLRQMQKGLFGMYIGALQNSYNKELNFDYRLELVKTLSESAQIFAQVLPINLRLEIIKYYKSLQPISSEFSSDYQKIVDAMSNQTCEGLCEVASK